MRRDLLRVSTRHLARDEPVLDVPPVVRTGLSGIDTGRLDGVDRLQDTFDFWPTGDAQEDLAAGADVADCRVGFAGRDSTQDVDARDDGAEIVRRPPDIGENAVRREAENAPAAVEDLLGDLVTEADPVLDLLLDPDQLDMRQVVGWMFSHQ
jgi:hypothetical protein